MDYKTLLKKAREKIPKASLEKARFEFPKIKGHIQGNKTMLTNFLQIADKLNRDPKKMLKFLLKELATPGDVKNSGTVILGRKISSGAINEKISLYTEKFVFCKECGKPDTDIIIEENINFLKCNACGAKTSIK